MQETDKGLTPILEYLLEKRGFDFSGYHPAMLARRIGQRLTATACKDFSAYLSCLQSNADELDLLLDVITINVSRFFRDIPPSCRPCRPAGVNESPRRKQRGILADHQFFYASSGGEYNPKRFKEALSGIDREMVAFANASGGRLFIGVTDQKAVRSIPIDNRLKSQVQDIANQCQPPVKILMEEYNNILIIHVHEGEDKPYKCLTGFNLRVGPNTQKLNRNEILDFIKSEGKVRFDELICTRFNYPKQFDGKKLNDFLNLSAITPPRDKKYHSFSN